MISLSPLDRAQIAKMVRELSSRHALPRDIVEGVSERTGGVPLSSRRLRASCWSVANRAARKRSRRPCSSRLPHGSIGSAPRVRPRSSPPARPGISYALLRAVADLDEGALRSALERLAEADILFVEGDEPQATYRFKHALIQDAAYDSLLKSRRQALHRRAAEILRDSRSASRQNRKRSPIILPSGLDDLAIEWWGKAGDQPCAARPSRRRSRTSARRSP